MTIKTTTPYLLAGLLLAPAVAFAQSQPTAGQLLQQTAPPPPPPSATAKETTVEEPTKQAAASNEPITVRNVQITGNSVFSSSTLSALIAGDIQPSMTLTGLDNLAARITRYYRNHGYLVARAYLPPQDVSEGVVTIAILEGHLGEITLHDNTGTASTATAPLHRLQTGDAVNRQQMEDALLRLSDLPGVEVKSTLRPGASVGSSDFLVELEPSAAFTGEVDVDNFGNRFVGAERIGASLYWNNPAKLGDQLSLRAQANASDFRYGRIGYQLPIGPWATRIGVAWSAMRYKLGKAFDVLDANGSASIGSFYVQQPLLRGRRASWYVNAQFDDKHLHDDIGIVHLQSRKTLHNATLGIRGDIIDTLAGGASNRILLNYTQGRLGMDAVSAFIDQFTAHSSGQFSKWSLDYQRLQRLPQNWLLTLNANAQWADKNLDSSEKLLLGGSTGVRAYPQGEASGDNGYITSVELRHSVAERIDAFGFYDAGRVRINQAPWGPAASNHRRLAGYGVGLSYAFHPFSVQVFAAWKAGTGEPESDEDKSPRLWAQAVYQF